MNRSRELYMASMGDLNDPPPDYNPRWSRTRRFTSSFGQWLGVEDREDGMQRNIRDGIVVPLRCRSLGKSWHYASLFKNRLLSDIRGT